MLAYYWYYAQKHSQSTYFGEVRYGTPWVQDFNFNLYFFKIMAELIKEFLVFGIFIIFLKVLLIMFSVTKSIFTYVTYFKVVLTDHVSSYFD